MITYNPVKKNGKFQVSGFDGTRTITAIDEANAKYKYLAKFYGKEMNGLLYNKHVKELTVKVIVPTERIYG